MSEQRGLQCEVCDLQFTSESQAEQHLQGKNHLKKVGSYGGGSTTSYNKDTNLWHRLSRSEVVSQTSQQSVDMQEDSATPTIMDPNFNKFYCDLCKVGAPSQGQMDMHLNGKNHKVSEELILEG